MEIEKILVKTSRDDLDRVQNVLNSLKDVNERFFLDDLHYSKIDDDVIISFTTEKSLYKQLLEKLHFNNLIIISDKESINEIRAKELDRLDHIKKKRGSKEDLFYLNQDGDSIDELARIGNYKELLKIIKSVHAGPDEIEHAKMEIDLAISNCIEITYKHGSDNKYLLNESILKLIKIASDPELSVREYDYFRKSAGLHAINLATLSERKIYKLVNICRNNMLHKFVCVAAAIKLAKFTFQHQDAFRKDINASISKINLRWLTLCYSMVQEDFSETEKIQFKNLVEYIKSKV